MLKSTSTAVKSLKSASLISKWLPSIQRPAFLQPLIHCRPHMKYYFMSQFVLTGRGFSFFEGILTEALEIFHSGKDRVNRLWLWSGGRGEGGDLGLITNLCVHEIWSAGRLKMWAIISDYNSSFPLLSLSFLSPQMLTPSFHVLS